MARGHLFLIVLLLAAAAVAGLLAVTRTAQSSPAASTGDPAISYRMKKLDRLEASLERQLARQAAQGKATQSAPAIVYQRAPAPVATTQHGGDEHQYSAEDEGDRDD